jgi:hypothetical protein
MAYYGVDKFLWLSIKHQIMSYILNFHVEIFLVLTFDFVSTDQAMNDSPFHVVWVDLKCR